ncbi:hydrogen peroxide-inducible genes activator [Bacteroides sp. 214]|uniref:hydrogen peroxide-inducible genes activator n=1 Tax=Bacteroides sp. 214 TaxID=2302935 RepID=UPI0013D578EB|nr:hydrogen peroxide-inducible genes activator [Bacteroides sp. 214]NDW11600.1 hydrogen peroxide-inducible genes activator [Bacteroides sp. 214]
MTLQQLEYILAVDKFRHFAKAAEHCGVTQPTLSAMIQKLEDELNVKIFDRHVQPVIPTNIGEKILHQARSIINQTLHMREVIQEEKHVITGKFRLAVLPTIAPYLIPRFFPQLRKKCPDLDLRVSERKTHEVFEGLKNDEIDAAIIASMPEDAKLQGDVLFYEEFMGYVSRNEPLFKNEFIRTSDVNPSRLWLLDEGHCFRDQLVRFCQLDSVKNTHVVYQLGSMETFMRMVESGNGMTFIPELALSQLCKEQKELVKSFAIPRPTRPIVLVTRIDFIRQSILKIVKENIKESVPERMLVLDAVQTLV